MVQRKQTSIATSRWIWKTATFRPLLRMSSKELIAMSSRARSGSIPALWELHSLDSSLRNQEPTPGRVQRHLKACRLFVIPYYWKRLYHFKRLREQSYYRHLALLKYAMMHLRLHEISTNKRTPPAT